jgi:chitodextrinase
MVVAFPSSTRGAPLQRFCRAQRRLPGRQCAVLAATPRETVAAARRNVADLVVMHVRTLEQLRMLRGVTATTHILALARIPAGKLDERRWARAVAIARQDATLDLAVTVGSVHQPALTTYLGVVGAGKQAAGVDAPGGGTDALPPAAPLALATSTASQTSVTLAWLPSTDNTGIAGYTIYRGAAAVGTTILTRFTVPELACGTSYEFAVTAYDAAGNDSPRTTLTASTSACSPGGDSTAPSTPSGLTKTGSAATVVSLSWSASTDAVGVAGYGVYRGGTLQTNVSGTSASVTGLTCATSYSFAVDAFDEAGNRSGKATVTAATSSCAGDTQAPTAPGSLSVTASTTTSINVSWAAATDNVGVTGYGLYRGGTSVGSSATTGATFGGLACATSYTIAVDAVDAAGNRSAKASTNASTAACSGGGGGAASVFMATSGSDSGPCTQGQPCQTLQRAYEAAAPGATVQIAAGTYPDQPIDAGPKSGSADVVFAPAPGSSVTFGGITVVRASHIEFRDLTITTDSYNRQNASYITWRRITMRDFFVRGADHISYIDGEVGPNDNSDVMNWITEPYQSSDPAQDILLDGMRIHDFWKHNAGAHVDCLGVDNSDRVVIRNSHFWNCEHFAIIPNTDPSGQYPRDLTIENNFIQCCGLGYYSIGIDSAAGALIRFNSISGTGIGFLGGSVSGVTIDSNVIDKNNDANCGYATWRYNVIGTGNACGGILAASGFVGQPIDLHLIAGAAAIDAGNPTSYPSSDIDGQSRPAGGRPDAGADER